MSYTTDTFGRDKAEDRRSEPWFKADKTSYGKHATALGAALSTIRRTAEAAALRFLLSEQMKGNDTPVIVLGDINDGQHSNTQNILTEQPKYLVGDSVGGGDVALYAEGGRLDLLVTLLEAYERKHFPMDLPDPVEAIKFGMEQ